MQGYDPISNLTVPGKGVGDGNGQSDRGNDGAPLLGGKINEFNKKMLLEGVNSCGKA